MQAQVEDVVLDEDQPRPPASKVEAVEHFDLVSFHVHGNEIDGRRGAGINQDLIERFGVHFDRVTSREAGDDELVAQRRIAVAEMQPRRATVACRGAGGLIDLGAAGLSKFLCTVGAWLDQDAVPTYLLQMPGLRAKRR